MPLYSCHCTTARWTLLALAHLRRPPTIPRPSSRSTNCHIDSVRFIHHTPAHARTRLATGQSPGTPQCAWDDRTEPSKKLLKGSHYYSACCLLYSYCFLKYYYYITIGSLREYMGHFVLPSAQKIGRTRERRPLEGARMRHQRPCRRPLRPERAALALWATPVAVHAISTYMVESTADV